MQLSFHLQLAVIVMTALAGTGCGASILLLWFSLGGDMQFVTMSAIYVVVTAVITTIGIFILRIAKNEPADLDQPQQE